MLGLATAFTALLVGFSPFFLGGNRPVLWGLNAIGTGLSLIVTAIAMAMRFGRQIDLASGTVTPAAIGWFMLLLWMLFQLFPWSSDWLGHPAWTMAAAALDEELAKPISVDPTVTELAVLRWLTIGGVFTSVYCLTRQRENAALFLALLVGFFCFYAIYGLVRMAFQIDRIWWLPVGSTNVLTSTFINRNTAATYFGLGALVATAMLARSFNSAFRNTRELAGAERREAVVGTLTRGMGGWLVIWLLLFGALLATTSRGGIIASLSAIGALLFLQAIRGRGKPTSASRLLISCGLLIVVFGLVELLGNRFLGRMIVSGFTDLDRLHAMEATLRAVVDHIWTGSGAGTFQSIFPLYRPSSLDRTGYWSSSHSDYLDALLGLGLPAFLVLLVIVASLAYKTLKGLMNRRRDSHFALIAVSATILVAIHGLVDFSMQIQGVTLTYVSLLALGAAQSQGSKRG